MPPSQYGEPKYPNLLSVSVSDEMNATLRELAGTPEFTSLSDVQRTLMQEAIDMRNEIEKAQRDFAATDEGAPCVPLPLAPERPEPRSHTVTRIGGQVVAPVRKRVSRATLVAQERGEE